VSERGQIGKRGKKKKEKRRKIWRESLEKSGTSASRLEYLGK
jgi:hypothetical protein